MADKWVPVIPGGDGILALGIARWIIDNNRYDKKSKFKQKGYPARRPWFPLTRQVFQEVIAGIADGYPYPVKAMIMNMGTPAYSIPGMKDIVITP